MWFSLTHKVRTRSTSPGADLWRNLIATECEVLHKLSRQGLDRLTVYAAPQFFDAAQSGALSWRWTSVDRKSIEVRFAGRYFLIGFGRDLSSLGSGKVLSI